MAFYISRFKDMDSKEFDVEVVTPMFLGGANIRDTELRAPSIKGVLRFWWRATCGIKSLKEMKEKEAEIFGSTNKKSSFSIQVDNPDSIKPVLMNLPQGRRVSVGSKNKKFKIGIIDYLTFGLMDRKRYSRNHIPPGSKFEIKFIFYQKEHCEDVLNAFYALINNGGLGAKSRNGFGSLCLKNAEKADFSSTGKLSEFTALSNKSKLFGNFGIYEKWEDALSEIGAAYITARLCIEAKKRLLIAKPIVQLGTGNDRHAKPYFLHINKLGDRKYQGQILFIPYQYYQSEKHDEYMGVCKKMNSKIAESLRRPK